MHAEKDMTANALINRLPELKISFEAVNIDIQSIDIGTAGGFEFFDQAGLAHEDYRRGEGGDADLYLREGVKDTADIHSHAPNGAGYHSNHLVDYIA